MIYHERVFDMKESAPVLPVFSLPSNGSTAWAGPYYGFNTPFFLYFCHCCCMAIA